MIDFSILSELKLGSENLLPFVEIEEGTGGLRNTDYGWVIEIPARLSEEKKLAFYLHCLGHYILEHHTRKPLVFGEDAIWNSACDYAVNSLLMLAFSTATNEKLKRARAHLYPYRREFEGMSAEAIYLVLLNENFSPSFGDTHEDFSEGGSPSQKIQEISNLSLDALRAGINKEEITQYFSLRKDIKIPSKLQSLFSQSLYTEEVLDILNIPYNRYWTVETVVTKLSVMHCVDISGSMQSYARDVLSVAYALVHYLYNLFSGRVEQQVSLMDVDEKAKWVGRAPDINLYKILKKPTGFGGTTYSTTLAWQLKKQLPDCLIIYSDLAFSYGYATDMWKFLTNEILPKIPITILIYPESVKNKKPFKITLPLSSFFPWR